MHNIIWTSILTPIGIGLLFTLLRRFFPVRAAPPLTEPLTDEERRLYRRWEIGSALLWLPIGFVLSFAWYLVLTGLAGLFSHKSPDTLFLRQPTWVFWGIPAFFLGMLAAVIPVDLFVRALLRDRSRRFERFCNERAGLDGNRVLIAFAVFILVGSVVFFVAGVTNFARFTELGVEIGRPLSFRTRFYDYRRIEAIEHRATFQAPAGNTLERPNYVILFDDGLSWGTAEGCLDPDPRVDDPIVRYVSLRSRKPILPRQ
jgi:hypothetical protein